MSSTSPPTGSPDRDVDVVKKAQPQRSRRRRLLRFVLRLGAGLALAVLFVLISVPLALRSSGVRDWLFAKVTARVEAATGFQVAVTDWRPVLRRGEIRIDGLEVRSPTGGVLLTTPRVDADLAWGSVLRPPIRLESLSIESPEIDLGVELPPRSDAPGETDAPTRLPIQIDRLRISQGSVDLPDLPENARGFLDQGRVSGIELEGQVLPESLDLRWIDSEILVVGERLGPPIVARGIGRLSGAFDRLRLNDLAITAEGLSLTGQGPLAFATAEPIDRVGAESAGDETFDLELHADAAKLFPALSPEGSLDVLANVDLARRSVETEIQAERFPAVLLEPFLGADTFARLEGERTTIEADAEFRFDPDEPSPLAADVTARWIRGQATLFEVTGVTSGGGRNAAGEVDLRALRGEAKVTAAALPLEVLRPWIGAQRFRDLDLGSSVLDLRLDGQTVDSEATEGDIADRFDAELDATWRRGNRRIAHAGGIAQIDRVGAQSTADADILSISGFRLARGEVEIVAPDLEGGLLSPFLPEALRQYVEPEGTRLAIDLDFALPRSSGRSPRAGASQARSSAPSGGLRGKGTVDWSRGETRLVGLTLTGEPSTGDSLQVAASAELLPTLPGERRASGVLFWTSRLPSVHDLLKGELSDGQARIEIDQMGSLASLLEEAIPGITGVMEDVGADRWQDSQARLLATAEASGPLDGLSGRIDFDLPTLDLALLDPLLGESPIVGTVKVRGDLVGTLDDFRAKLDLESRSLQIADLDPITQLSATLHTDGDALHLDPLSLRWRGAGLQANGEVDLSKIDSLAGFDQVYELPDARLDVVVSDPFEGIQKVAATLRQTLGDLTFETTDFVSDGGTGRVMARAPVARLTEIDAIEGLLSRFRIPQQTLDAGPLPQIRVAFELPEIDTAKLLPLIGMDYQEDEVGSVSARRVRRVVAKDVRGMTEFLLDNWRAARGAIDIASLELELDERRFVAGKPAELRLDAGELTLRKVRLDSISDDLYLELFGRGTLAPEWRLGSPWSELASLVELEADGVVPASQLNPFLAGGVAQGPLEVHAKISAEGSVERYRGSIEARGENAVLLYAEPYETRIEAPELVVTLDPSGAVLEKAHGRLNRGEFTLTGPLFGEEGLLLRADLTQVRYRLDYGLVALLSGNIALAIPPEGRSSLTGVIVLERGVIRQRIDLERELRGLLLGIPDITGTEQSAAENVDLDLTIITYSGVKITNNLADLTAVWTPLQIRGTLAEPLVEGKIEVDPGGLFTAYGQVFRLDTASIELTGLPGVEPKIEAATTSSLQDPSLLRRGGQDAFATQRQTSDAEAQTAVAAGLADYYGGMLAEALTDTLGSLRVNIEPLLLFTESDPDARFTVSQDLNQYLALGVSINLRSAERRTYLLDLHGFDIAPGLSAQVFTNEEQEEGVTLQHSVELGGGSSGSRVGRRIEKIRLPEIANISTRRLRSALDYKEGEELPEGGLFDLEVAAGDYLRSHGYPEARVVFSEREIEPKKERKASSASKTEESTAAPRRRVRSVELAAQIHAGTFATVEFVGDQPHRTSRTEIRSLYRPGFFERAAVEAMTDETERALRAEGFADPQVEISIEAADPTDPESSRKVTVRGIGGRKLELGSPRFLGMSEEDAAYLTARFLGPVARIELAAGLESADRRLLVSLRNLGFHDAEIVRRAISEDGKTLEIVIAPGEPRRVAAIEIQGLEPEQEALWRPQLPLGAGDRLRNDLVARAAYFLEQNLRRLGHAQAKVRPKIGTVETEGDAANGAGSGGLATVTLEAEPGPIFRIDDILFEGQKATRPRFAKKLVGLEQGELLDEAEIARGRRRLLTTGSFDGVSFETRRAPDGTADIRFSLEEKRRYRLSYGVRFESSDGVAVVVDARDRNLFGRGITLGARALEADKESAFRLFGSVPRLFGTRLTLELLGESRELIENGLIDRQNQTSLQLARPFGEHFTGRAYGRYRTTRVREVEPDPFFPFDETVSSPVLGVQMVFDDRVSSRLGRDGLFATLDFSGAGKFLGSDFSYLRAFGQANYSKGVTRIWGRKLVWAQSLRLGVAESFDNQELIRDVRFFAGGEYSVRGYDTESIGPREDFGFLSRPRGGEALLVINQELRFSIVSRYSGTLFFDAGSVGTGIGALRSDLFKSTGLGLRAETPLGLIRLDIAFPLDQRAEDDSVKFYIGLGHVF